MPAANGMNGKPPTVNGGKSKRTRRRRSGRNTNYSTQNVYPHVQAPGVSNNATKLAKFGSALRMLQSNRISPEGMAFLKCAFAPPDFANSKILGVPDDFQGRSLVKKHRSVSPVNFATANTDYYYLVLPVPGYQYFFATSPAGVPLNNATVFVGVPYSDFASFFADRFSAANIVDKFRFVSQHFELIPTVNQANWSGSIQAFRLPIAVGIRPGSAASGPLSYNITGINGVNATNVDMYTGPFNLGVYTAGYNTGATFNFSQIFENVVSVPNNPDNLAGDFGVVTTPTGTGFTGFDNQFDSLLIKVSGMGTNVSNSGIIKTWACVEYQAVTGSSVYEYQNFSPCDHHALDLYRKIINELPVGVSFVDNDGFWARVLAIIRNISGAASVLPGPYGMAASGVNTLATALGQLTM